jgi:acyl carrier protein
MKPTEARDRIVKAIVQIQENSGREIPKNISGRFKPIGDLEGFDSLNGLELSVMIAAEFDIDTQDNLCISEDGRRALTVTEMVARVCGT